MAIPLIPLVLGGGLAALLFAGSKEAKAAAPGAPSSSATPTQAATGGANGGAQYPSHSDVGATGEVTQASSTQTGGGIIVPGGRRGEDGGSSYTVPDLSGDLFSALDGAKAAADKTSVVETGQEAAFTVQDPEPILLPSWIESFGISRDVTSRTLSSYAERDADLSGKVY